MRHGAELGSDAADVEKKRATENREGEGERTDGLSHDEEARACFFLTHNPNTLTDNPNPNPNTHNPKPITLNPNGYPLPQNFLKRRDGTIEELRASPSHTKGLQDLYQPSTRLHSSTVCSHQANFPGFQYYGTPIP